MIVVTGATGTIGSHLIRLLSKRGAPVRAVSRNVDRAEVIEGVDWVSADLADRTSIRDVCKHADALFLLTGNDEQMVRLQKNAIAAATGAGVRRIVKLSALGSSDHSKSVIGTWHHAVEHRLAHTDIEWTVLRPHVFMQNLLDQRDSIRDESVIRSPAADGRIPFIDTRDIADVAAVLLTTDGHGGQTYTLTGGEAITYGDVATILSRVLGRPVSYVAESLDDAWSRLRANGLPVWHVAAQLALAEYQRTGGATAHISDTVEQLTGQAPRSFEMFATDYAEELR